MINPNKKTSRQITIAKVRGIVSIFVPYSNIKTILSMLKSKNKATFITLTTFFIQTIELLHCPKF